MAQTPNNLAKESKSCLCQLNYKRKAIKNILTFLHKFSQDSGLYINSVRIQAWRWKQKWLHFSMSPDQTRWGLMHPSLLCLTFQQSSILVTMVSLGPLLGDWGWVNSVNWFSFLWLQTKRKPRRWQWQTIAILLPRKHVCNMWLKKSRWQPQWSNQSSACFYVHHTYAATGTYWTIND